MKQAGFILALIAVILDVFISGYGAIVLLSTENFQAAGLLTLAIVVLEVIAIVNFKKSNGWVIFLLIIGVIALLVAIANSTGIFIPLLLVLGTIFRLIGRDEFSVDRNIDNSQNPFNKYDDNDPYNNH